MEQLDVIFANRYLTAYRAYVDSASLNGMSLPEAWRQVFDAAGKWWPVTGQHLVMGINVHINLDLGIAAAETVGPAGVSDIKNDFEKINSVLKSMVNEVEKDLAKIWWPLHIVDFLAGKLDEHLARFGIEYARDHAWRVAEKLSNTPLENWASEIDTVDKEVLKIGQIIEKPSFMARLLLFVMRVTEFKRPAQITAILE